MDNVTEWYSLRMDCFGFGLDTIVVVSTHKGEAPCCCIQTSYNIPVTLQPTIGSAVVVYVLIRCMFLRVLDTLSGNEKAAGPNS
jgi:hypothetical protein